MEREHLKIKNWIEDFNNGLYSDGNVKVQIQAGWYDWFCKDSSLANKTKKMGNIIKQVKRGGKVDLENWYVWFKNNCPMSGPLYDDFRFADFETGEVQFTIQINCCWSNYRYSVYSRRKGFEEPTYETNSSRELVKWFNTPWEG